METATGKTAHKAWKTTAYYTMGPSGEVKLCRLPSCFGVEELIKRLPHHEVFLKLPHGHSVYGKDPFGENAMLTEGVVWWSEKHDAWVRVGDHIPADDREAYHMIQNGGGY